MDDQYGGTAGWMSVQGDFGSVLGHQTGVCGFIAVGWQLRSFGMACQRKEQKKDEAHGCEHEKEPLKYPVSIRILVLGT